MESLRGKVCLITGSSSGIGAAAAVLFAKYGARLVLTGRNQERLEKVAQKCKDEGLTDKDIKTCVADICNEEEVRGLAETAIEHFGTMDVLVNNAGHAGKFLNLLAPTDDMLAELDLIFALHVRAPALLINLLMPHIKTNKGSVINISSIRAYFPGPAHSYCMMKAAMSHMVKGLAKDLARDGVRVNAVSPGYIRTEIFETHDKAYDGGADPLIKKINKTAVSGRLGTAEEVASLIAFLASDAASYINGQDLIIDGGEATALQVAANFD